MRNRTGEEKWSELEGAKRQACTFQGLDALQSQEGEGDTPKMT
jgi:hypothetical protein